MRIFFHPLWESYPDKNRVAHYDKISGGIEVNILQVGHSNCGNHSEHHAEHTS